MVAGDLLVLFFDLRSRLNPGLVSANLLLDPSLFLLGVGHGCLRRAKLRLEL